MFTQNRYKLRIVSIFYAVFTSLKDLFFLLFFPDKIMYILNIVSAIKKMNVNELRDFIFANYCKQIGLDLLKKAIIIYYSVRHLKKTIAACNQMKRKNN